VRGWSGRTSGRSEAIVRAAPRRPARSSGLSTFSGRCSVRRPYGVDRAEEGVDHCVADEFDALVRDSLPGEVLARVAARREEERREVVAEPPVDLLGHEEVVAAETRLDVRDRVVLLRGDERAGERRVDVSDDDHDGRVEAVQLGLESSHDPRGLFGMAPRADAQVGVGLRQAELGEEDVGKLRVVVLAGVHQRVREAGARCRLDHRRGLHEVRPRARDDEKVGHRQASSSASSQAEMAVPSANRSSA
jgi:hypothetical protein